MFKLPDEEAMKQEELMRRTWLNAISDPTVLPRPPQQPSLTSQSSSSSFNNPFPNGFSFWGDEVVINNNNENDSVQLQLSRDLSAMIILDDDHPLVNNNNTNNAARTIIAPPQQRRQQQQHANTPARSSFDANHAHNNNLVVVPDETVTVTPPPRQQQHHHTTGNSTKSPWGVSVSSHDVKWGLLPKEQPFVGISRSQVESSSSSSMMSLPPCGRGCGGVKPCVQLQKQQGFASSFPYLVSTPGLINNTNAPTPTPTPTPSPFVFSSPTMQLQPQQLQQPQPNRNIVPPLQRYYMEELQHQLQQHRQQQQQQHQQQQLPQSVSLSPIRDTHSHTHTHPVAFKCDNSFILQEKEMKRGCNSMWGGGGGGRRCCGQQQELPVPVPVPVRVPVTIPRPVCENSGTLDCGDQPYMMGFGSSLNEVQGYMFHMAKDQNGCRFLQRIVDEGSTEDLEIVFKGIIDNVVELMMDPFGNYLVQKLLDLCRDDQRLQIVQKLTNEPGQLVRTSLNTHGTRVVQKLISTLKSSKQISLVRSAIQPGFLQLIKDLNGNHVIQRCLQSLKDQDNEFIFEAATKFCVDIATHQHGCCVLQRCIDYSTGKSQDKLVKEICKHGLRLAQDPFGNYVVQYIIEMQNPSATAKLTAQFKGNYVALSMQKFSSHVVEKCLKHVAESRSRIVHEFLSVDHFEQLLQDPFANYVIQRALAVTKGVLHASLAEAVRPHRILRTSPYCKRIFSKNLLKK